MRPDEDRICHSETLRNIAVGSTDPSVTVAASKWNLEMSVECKTLEGLTLDALTRSSRSGSGRLEIEHISVNPVGEEEITYRIRARLTQPPRNDSKRAYMVIGPRHQRGRIKT